ncbi:transcription factor bHLH94-like [Miscanthus floridulus]|uniref:transcription factor bHLH94-like n=1 Tax=Miscanthus floridulus TaxID=154761 RepID=UPI003457CED3
MALEAVVFPKELLACTVKARPASLGCGFHTEELEDKGGVVLQGEAAEALPPPGSGSGAATTWEWDAVLFPCSTAPGAVEECWDVQHQLSVSPPPPVPSAIAASSSARGKAAAAARRRLRRPKAVKNTEEMESQRRNHIAVERNRRRQMNEYLSVLRSAMPPSYAQRGDQASIVAGAINFVKELEQLLQSLEAQKRRQGGCTEPPPPPAPFAGFFTFPQYSTAATGVVGSSDSAGSGGDQSGGGCAGAGARRGVADIEVALAESHANVKVLAPRRPRQLLRMVVALQCLGLTVLHLNVTTTADHLAFYSLSLKMEDECRLSSVDDIAAAVNEILGKISDECAANYLLAA